MKTTATLLLILCLFACKKKDERLTTTASLICHSQAGSFTIKYHDKDDWHTETITQKDYTKTFEVFTDDITWGQHVMSTALSDSCYITGTIDGKSVQAGFKSTSGTFDLSVQLSNAK